MLSTVETTKLSETAIENGTTQVSLTRPVLAPIAQMIMQNSEKLVRVKDASVEVRGDSPVRRRMPA